MTLIQPPNEAQAQTTGTMPVKKPGSIITPTTPVTPSGRPSNTTPAQATGEARTGVNQSAPSKPKK